MGQYHYVVNLDKREYLHPHRLGDGLKLLEFGDSRSGTMLALSVLLAAQNVGGARGGGDLNSDDPVVGSWASDRIVIAGDYADPADAQGYDTENGQTLYESCANGLYTEISDRVRAALLTAGENIGGGH